MATDTNRTEPNTNPPDAQLRFEPLVSVVIPVLNGERTIARTVGSVFEQDYPQIQVVVVDDASTDSTRSILESFGSRIHPIFVEKNRGTAGAYNLGVKAAQGEVVLLMASDCYLAQSDYISRAVGLLGKDDKLAGVCGRGVVFEPDELSLVQRTFIIVNFLDVIEDGDDGAFEVAFFETRCDVMRMDALREVGFWFEGLYNSTEDQDISARIRQRGYKLLQDNRLEFGLDFGQTEDTFFKIFKKQFQYANGQAYIFVRYGLGHHLLSGGESNRQSRIWQRFIQIGLAPATVLLGVATIVGANVGWVLIALLASRALYYWHRSRKTLKGVYRALCSATGVVCDLIYGSSFLSGLILWALLRPGDVRFGRPVLEKRKNP